MKFCARLILGMLIFAVCRGAERGGAYLEPVAGYFASYPHSHAYSVAVRDVLVGDAWRSPAMMVTLPSFRPESVVFLDVRGKQTFVASVVANAQIWYSEKRESITVTRKEKLLRPEVALAISAVFAQAAGQSRYPKGNDQGLDGVSFYFSAFVEQAGVRAGQTWSPGPQTVCGRLVALGEHLSSYARGEFSAEQLEAEAREILLRLKENER